MGTTNQPQRPATTIRAGGIKATVWENQTKDGNTYYSVSLSRSYKDGEEWKETNSYYRDDLPKVELVTRKAFEFIHLEAERQVDKAGVAPEPNGSGEPKSFAKKVEQERQGKADNAAAAEKS